MRVEGGRGEGGGRKREGGGKWGREEGNGEGYREGSVIEYQADRVQY